ncbi:hypothetical protein V8B97DRAFT_2003513 [Scleroderma yunnanense]
MSSTSYPVPPPSYQATGTSKAPYIPTDATEPLLGRPSSPGGRIYDQPEAGDLPDDFKYGVTVSESALEVQAAFVRKLATTIVAGCISQSFDTVVWITTQSVFPCSITAYLLIDLNLLSPWSFYVPLFVMTGIVGIFIPFSHTVDLVYAILGCLIFSGYIVFDTYMIMKRLSPDEYIVGSLSLYLE